MSDATADFERKLADAEKDLRRLKERISGAIVGMDDVVESVLICLLTGGHALLEGVPGLGKTMLVRTLAESLDLKFSRVQFTPDLMPADITGTTLVASGEGGAKSFEFQRGPIFANIVLADEINRATPKTQSALLEAMQEGSVTTGGKTHRLDSPFLVLATQNPIEMEGTYPLPEAQLDRFLQKILVRFPSGAELRQILDRTTGASAGPAPAVLGGLRILALRDLVRSVPAADHVKDYAVRLVLSSHPKDEGAAPLAKRFVRFGASPRGAQALVLGAKARALLQGRINASIEDVQALAGATLRHRILLNFEGESEGVDVGAVVDDLLRHVASAATVA
jgi:MoxR-like ATPase